MTELTDRMRTCAAHILSRTGDGHSWAAELVAIDAAALLTEAASIIEEAKLGTVVVDTQTAVALGLRQLPVNASGVGPAVWTGDDLRPVPNAARSRNACPNCDSRTTKIVHKCSGVMQLECPVCGSFWRP